MKKSVILTILVVLIIALAFVAYWYWNKDKSSEQELTLYGNVDIRQVSLAFEQAGRIQRLNVQEGDQVHQGQILA